jgi:hypothetical protein
VGLPTLAVLMLACAVGISQKRYWALLGFQAPVLLVVPFCVLLPVRARNAPGSVAGFVGLVGPGYLLSKLVGVLSRIQMPIPPGGFGTRPVAGNSRHARHGPYRRRSIGSAGDGGHDLRLHRRWIRPWRLRLRRGDPRRQLGMKTAVIETDRVGGRCLNYACIPAKAVLRVADIVSEIRGADDFGIKLTEPEVDFSAVKARREGVVKALTGGVSGLFKKNKSAWAGAHQGAMKCCRRSAGRRSRLHSGAQVCPQQVWRRAAGPRIVAASTNPRFGSHEGPSPAGRSSTPSGRRQQCSRFMIAWPGWAFIATAWSRASATRVTGAG